MEKDKKPFNKQEYDNKYIKNNYDRLNFLMPKGTKDKINSIAASQGISASEYLRKIISVAVESGINQNKINIPDLAAYARSAKMTEEEYILQAVKEKMQRQDNDFVEEVTRINQ